MIWPLEALNGLRVAAVSMRPDDNAQRASFAHCRLNLTTRQRTDMDRNRHLAERFALSSYDAAYLELVQRRHLPLASLDAKLRAAAAALGITVLGS
jgi:predicted nucleic acid-binding protein